MLAHIWEVVAPALKTILVVLVIGTMGVLCVHLWTARRVAEDTAARVSREAALARAGLLVEGEQTQRQLESRLKEEIAASELFRAALAEAQAKLGHPTPVVVVHASTGAVPVEYHPATSPATPPSPVPGAQSAPGACVLRDGEQGEIRVTEATLEERSGARVVVGAAECWRLAPDERLLSGRYSVPVSSAASLAPPAAERSRWGAGAYVGVGRGGWVYGPAIALPQWQVLGISVETTVGAGLGSGTAQAGATVIGRW